MWGVLKQADIEEAREALKLRRAETLQRHADELAGLDADKSEIETLERLIAAFTEKFKNAAAPSSAPSDSIAADPAPAAEAAADPGSSDPPPAETPAAAEPAETVPAAATLADAAQADPIKVTEIRMPLQQGGERHAAKVRQVEQRGHARTNFDAFSRAIAKVERGW